MQTGLITAASTYLSGHRGNPERRPPAYVVRLLAAMLLLATGTNAASVLAQEPGRSHAPLRQAIELRAAPLPIGPTLKYVDASGGDDAADGSKTSPWKTIGRAARSLKAGETLVLREGIYYENVYLALRGRADAPITVRSYPGETAVVDGSFPQFFHSPETAWEPVTGKDAAEGEFRSREPVPNLRNVVGSFGDSMIGLQTYYHPQDLRSESETVRWQDPQRMAETDIEPLYCGPGLWYDSSTGHLHIRLSHTHLPAPISNYRGPTDPRRLPLLIAPFRSVPLTLSGARHLRFQDLTIRGAGYTAVAIDQAEDIEFDHVTIWCGTYGMRVSGSRDFRFLHSALYGNVAPWTFRGDGSKRDYPGRPHRNISRLNTHALLEIESGRESSVYATPQNDRWEIAYSHFADAHDALYLGAINVRFHHNLVENMQDDGLYLSPMYLRHRLDEKDPRLLIYQNVFRQMLTALAFGGSEPDTRDDIYIFRNVFDLRYPINTGRPRDERPEPGISYGKLMGDHGSPPWPQMAIYHNTILAREPSRDAAMAAAGHVTPGNARNLFNNIFYHAERLPAFTIRGAAEQVAADGNLYWSSPAPGPEQQAAVLSRFQKSEAFEATRQFYPPGATSHAQVADPFPSRNPLNETGQGAELPPGSGAIDRGVEIPAEWPDPLRDKDAGPPDIGAYVRDMPLEKVGP